MLASVFLLCVGATCAVPDVVVDHDNVIVRESCRIIIPPRTVIEDGDDNGVIQIAADGITVEFADSSVLIGNSNLADRDLLKGTGIRLHGHRNVTLKNVKVEGYKLAVWADESESFTIDHANISKMYSRRLLSTPEAEDASDWFYPHHNDETPWRTEYGGAIVIERSKNAIIHDVRIRDGQNGIILDRVDGAQLFDNDCSFLSGWGLAMWRSNSNTVSHNAFDFCIRGYSHGVYNRGQDSAGILIFEQCSRNMFFENSITHGGDGIFGFAGREAIGEITVPGLNPAGLGCNDNEFVGNDLSYAAAHGFEMTFSHRNTLTGNRFVENAICGIWGGYSQDMGISGNEFTGNGSAGYGLERGGINIEHGSGNQITGNSFERNAVAVHLWWDNDGKLLELPGIKATYRGVADNVVAENSSTNDEVFLRIRDVVGGEHIKNLQVVNNKISQAGKEFDIASDITFSKVRQQIPTPVTHPDGKFALSNAPRGQTHPVGARPALRGRQNIIMTQWGPWDHASPLVQVRPMGTQSVLVDVLEPAIGAKNESKSAEPNISTTGAVKVEEETPRTGKRYLVNPLKKGALTPYTVQASLGETMASRTGVLLDAVWDVTFFPWDKLTDPRENVEGWRRLAAGASAVKAQAANLKFNFAHRGPGALKLVSDAAGKALGNDHFGLIARTSFNIPAGNWKFVLKSDDGVRLKINGQSIVENWTWHAPTTNEGTFQQAADGEAQLELEYFEIDGFATLDLEIQQAK